MCTGEEYINLSGQGSLSEDMSLKLRCKFSTVFHSNTDPRILFQVKDTPAKILRRNDLGVFKR